MAQGAIVSARTPLEDCRRSRKLDAEYNRTVIANLVSQRDALREALMDIVDIASHRWRALPQGTPEKDRLAKSRAALAIADGAR